MINIFKRKFKHNDSAPFDYNYSGSLANCLVCNAEVSEGSLMVEVWCGGYIIDRNVFPNPDQSDGGYMGYYPVGSECAKKFAKGVLQK